MNSYVEFEPTVFENNSYKKIEVNNMVYKNLEIVLDYYNVDYKINEQGKFLIKRSLVKDKDLLFNYTTKTFDQLWLNSHTNKLKN
jgi:hypothetical protein